MSAARPVVFSPDLEQAALSAIIAGKLPLSTVKPEELSKEGRTVHEAVRVLQAASGESELPYRSVLVAAVDKLGADRKTLREYLKAVRKTRSGAEVDEVLRSVRNRQAVVSLIDECTEQLGTGNFDLATLAGKLAGKLAVGTGGTLVPVSELVKSGIPESPRGLVFGQLPELSRVSGGLMKLWVIGGEPKIGKSTLALQLALYASQHIPVLYYDFENGQDTMVFHLYEALGKDIAKLQRITGNLFLRDSIRTLETDMAVLKPPALIVVDSLQKLPTRADGSARSKERARIETLQGTGKITPLAGWGIGTRDRSCNGNHGSREGHTHPCGDSVARPSDGTGAGIWTRSKPRISFFYTGQGGASRPPSRRWIWSVTEDCPGM